ncbi:MAG: flagellar hook-basal body complex protein FliE [Myxococcota bacterium]
MIRLEGTAAIPPGLAGAEDLRGRERLPTGQSEALSRPDEAGGEEVVEQFGEALVDAVDGVNQTHAETDETVQSFLAGEDVPPHQVMIALSKADLSMRLTSTITTRAIAAYQEIARMQV